MSLDEAVGKPVVFIKKTPPAIVTQLSKSLSRANDIGEQHGGENAAGNYDRTGFLRMPLITDRELEDFAFTPRT